MLFVKLYGSQLCTSSLWSEPPSVRIVFLWFLVTADEDGVVAKCDVRAIARMSNVPLEEAEKAVEVLMAPDPISRSSEAGGRRLVLNEAGDWIVVNAVKYRDFRTHKQVYDAERQRKLRSEKKPKKRGYKAGSSKTRHEREIQAFDNTTGKGEWT
jgi:hypothetical protein